jgi:hypothetical protein
MKKFAKINKSTEGGQSLIEVAIVLPILIILIVGVVELSNLLNTQNKLTTASRVAAGFGAANYDRDSFETSTSVDMGQVALNAITQTLILDPNRWDIWAIRAQTDSTGGAFSVFTYTHYADFGNYQVVSAAEWESMVPTVKQDILDALKSVCQGSGDCANAADLEIVSSVPFYRPEPILGLPLMQWLNLDRMRGLTVMRVDKPPEVLSCPLLPIAVRLNQWSMYPSNWYDPVNDVMAPPLDNGYVHQVQPFPPFDDMIWEFPYCMDSACAFPKNPTKQEQPLIPRYENVVDPTNPLTFGAFVPGSAPANQFPLNVPGTPVSPTEGLSFPKGYLFWAREQDSASGNFGWLTWNGDNSTTKLLNSFSFPAGDFMYPFDYPAGDGKISKTGGYIGSRADMGQLVNINDYPNQKSGDGDGRLEIGEWVEGVPGNVDNTGQVGVQPWIFDPALTSATKSRPVVILLFDQLNIFNNGQNTNYRVAGFILARMLGYSFGGAAQCSPSSSVYPECTLYDGKWIVFELLGPADQCYNPDSD